jgi:hypothetical protein
MPRSDRSPSIVPPGNDQDVYLVLDDFGGRIGQAWRETGAEAARLETVIADLLDGQYSSPVRVVGFNTAEGWSRDVSEDVAREISRRCAEQARELPAYLQDFVERQEARAAR